MSYSCELRREEIGENLGPKQCGYKVPKTRIWLVCSRKCPGWSEKTEKRGQKRHVKSKKKQSQVMWGPEG